MADITDPLVIKYLGERTRVRAEMIRELKTFIDDDIATYFAQIDGLISGNADGDLIEDNRADQGVSRCVKSDLVNFITVEQDLQTALDVANKMDVVRKPTVQPPRS